VAEGDAVQQRLPGCGEGGEGLPAVRLDDLVAAGDQAADRLDGEEVADLGLEAGPAGAAEGTGEAGAVVDPHRVPLAVGVEIAQRLLRTTRLADHTEAAALAAAHRAGQSRLARDPAEERLAAGGAGWILGAGTGLEGDDAKILDLAHADSVRLVTKAETLERESRWALPVALATLLALVLFVAARFVNEASGEGAAEILRSIDEHSGSVTLSGLMQAAAFALLAVPLLYLFRAARARSDQVRSQLVGLVVAAPLFLALTTGLTMLAQQEAADEFVAGKAKPTLTKQEANEECVEERRDEGKDFLAEEYEPEKGEDPLRACESRKLEDDAASEARADASFTPLATGFGLAGALGIIFAFFYTCLWAMRTGLLSRFWGSLGMALGIATLFGMVFFLLAWLIYFALLVIGKLPNGRPPAWEAGEAVPWPTPGERVAAEMEPEDGWDDDEPDPDPGGEKRKRKRRE